MRNKMLLAVCAASLVQAPASWADESGITLTPSIGYMDYDSDRGALADTAADPDSYDDDGFYSFGIGYRYDSPWQIELAYAEGDTGTSIGDIDFSQIRLDGLYHLDTDNSVVPYFVVGAGENEFDEPLNKRKETIVNYGVGFKYAINEVVAARTDLRAITSLDEEDTDVALTLGLQFLLGGGSLKPAPAPAPTDSDNDGVTDANDRCPNTPVGVQVDAQGCALDDDDDGVPNHQDNCPDSEAGARVDEEGCYILLQETREIELQVNFPNNSSIIGDQYLSEIKAVADFMTEYPNTEAVIEGHTDSSGSEVYNQLLSERRANKVAETLVEQFSVAAGRVSSVGYGEARPVADNSTAAGRSSNRRVVAVISTTVEKRAK